MPHYNANTDTQRILTPGYLNWAVKNAEYLGSIFLALRST